ncbi:MAG: hypothetical protein IKB93_08060 [Clostridia bacterium]|nr:hypothetical protein [Clostridia bacterium]
MEIEVLFERGDGIYIIKMDDGFYLVNLEICTISERKQYIDSFLKFGYFTPVENIDVKILDSIKEITALQRYSATAEGTSIIDKM